MKTLVLKMMREHIVIGKPPHKFDFPSRIIKRQSSYVFQLCSIIYRFSFKSNSAKLRGCCISKHNGLIMLLAVKGRPVMRIRGKQVQIKFTINGERKHLAGVWTQSVISIESLQLGKVTIRKSNRFRILDDVYEFDHLVNGMQIRSGIIQPTKADCNLVEFKSSGMLVAMGKTDFCINFAIKLGDIVLALVALCLARYPTD